MGLTDLFRPKYRHSDASVRAEAVRQLGADEAELVAQIARSDRDPSVRRIAIDKIGEASILAALAEAEPEQALRERARARASELWVARAVSSGDARVAKDSIAGLARLGNQRAIAEVASRASEVTVRDAAMNELKDARALAELARNPGTNPALATAALTRIDDPEVLRSIAIDEQRKDIALLAVDRIKDNSILDAVANKAKNKAVRARARKVLSDNAPATAPAGETVSPEDKRRHAERVQLVKHAEQLARGDEWVQSAAVVAGIEQEWKALGAGDDAALAMRFETARNRYHARRKAFQDAAAAAKKKEAQRPERPEKQGSDRAGARQASEKTGNGRTGARAADAGRAADGGRAAAPPAAGTEQQASKRASGPANETAASGSASEAAAAPAPTERVEQVAAGEAQAARPAEQPQAAPDPQAEQRRQEAERERKERQAKDLATLTQLTRELEAAAEATKRKQTDKAVQKAEKALDELDLPPGSEEAVARYQAARQAAIIKLKELREAEDWERWANVPRQEALIAKAEALLHDPDENNLAERLKAVQAEWKNVGPVPQKKSKELWDRFKATCDQVYERVKGTRARVNEEMAVNLKRKEELCERVEALADSTEWEATAEQIKQLQREWRTIGPVPRKRSDEVWTRFRTACDRFFERRKPYIEGLIAERDDNLKKKEALCQEAETLAESTDWKETSLRLRDLQREWREVGPVPRKDANAINKRFRAACDRFFQRRDEQRQAERTARERAVDALRAEIRAVLEGSDDSAVASTPAPAEASEAGEAAVAEGGTETAPAPRTPVERALHIRATLRDMELTEAEEDELLELANQLYRKLLAEQPEGFRGTELDPEASRQKKAKLCARAEELAPASKTVDAPSDAQTPEQMAERLRAALAANALSSSLARSTEGRNLADVLVNLESSWRRVGPVPGPEGDDLEARFQAACARARQAAGL